jgi:hypothetical protein
METSVLQTLIFEQLRQTPATTTNALRRTIPRLANGRGLITDEAHFTEDDHERVREIVWSLIIQGVLVPGSDSNNPSLPHIKVTGYGKQVLAAGSVVPHDPDGYLENLRTSVANIDAVILLYVREALSTFRTANYLPSAVMLGVAAEKVMLLLVDAVRNAFADAAKQTSFEKDTKGKPIKRQYDEVRKRIERILPSLPAELSDVMLLQFDGIYDFIRR